MDEVTAAQVVEARLDDWRKLSTALHARFLTGSHRVGLALVAAVADLAGDAADVRLTAGLVDVALASPATGRATVRDLDLARQISAAASAQGVAADPGAVTRLELALDTADLAAVGPFWAALLTGSADGVEGDELVDPTGRVPLLWFQGTDAHEEPRQRFHVDLWVAHDVAQQRIEAAVAAGGRVVDDRPAPSYVVLADPEGNKVCVCTFLGR